VDITTLERHAIDLAKNGNFGSQGVDLNLQLTRLAPSNQGAWTRLARCYMELGQLDEATAALESALQLNPQNTIARNLQMEVVRRRSGVTSRGAAPRARTIKPKRGEPVRGPGTGGFGRAEFAALGQLKPANAMEALGARIEALLMTINDRAFAAKAVETRNRAGHAGVRLFRRNGFHPGAAGHLFAFHHGGRWEPQLNIGLFAAASWGRDALRAGIGFDLRSNGRDAAREADRARLLDAFDHFQHLVSSTWRHLLTDWMGANGGFIQYADRPAATDVLPKDAVAWLINCQNPADVGWIFCGRWLFADRAADADTLADAGSLARWIEQTFSDLLPLWVSLYRRR
jgi:tetratricopeptide (TPR) repeat protein